VPVTVDMANVQGEPRRSWAMDRRNLALGANLEFQVLRTQSLALSVNKICILHSVLVVKSIGKMGRIFKNKKYTRIVKHPVISPLSPAHRQR